ncbi:hypothetical protein ONS96_005868 [Cadophora gregata f. sp. sojae]|nr:hypothetical protein ONS96_005868 [Cadophora gregata f. sp. sojae]
MDQYFVFVSVHSPFWDHCDGAQRPRRKRGKDLRLVACSLHSCIFMVNKEARKVAQKFYSIVDSLPPGYHPVLLNPNNDLLCPVTDDALHYIQRKENEGRNLGFGLVKWEFFKKHERCRWYKGAKPKGWILRK